MEERATFKFFRSYYDAVAMLPNKEQQADFLLALCRYALDGILPELDGAAAAMFLLAKPNIDASRRKYEAGALGGRPRKNQTETNGKPNENQMKPEEGRRKKGSKEEGSMEVGGGEEHAPARLREEFVQWAANVFMTDAEHAKLVERFGAADTDRLVDILDNYKGASGKSYASDYRAILSWCVDKLREQDSAAARRPDKGGAAPGRAALPDRQAREDMERIRRLMERERGK